MQTVLDSAPERTTVPVPRVWLQAWLTSLRTVLALRDAPLASGAVVLYVASGVMGILVGLAGGWLLC
jgi:hypothetical protein